MAHECSGHRSQKRESNPLDFTSLESRAGATDGGELPDCPCSELGSSGRTVWTPNFWPFIFFETGFQVAQDGFELIIQLRLALNFDPPPLFRSNYSCVNTST